MARSQIHYQKPRIKSKHKTGLQYKLAHWLRRLFRRHPGAKAAR